MPPDLLTPLPTPPTPAELEAVRFEQTTKPGEANSYTLNWHGRADAIEDPAALHTLDQNLRQFGADVGLPSHIGGSVLAQAVDDLRRYERMTEAEKAVHVASQKALLGRILPGVSAEDIVAGAEKVLAKADKQFVATARQNGLFSSVSLMVQLYTQSLRDQARGLK